MHAVPVSARISFVYVEKGVLEQDGHVDDGFPAGSGVKGMK